MKRRTKPLRPSILRRIRHVYDNASDIALAAGRRWYTMAFSECLHLSRTYNVPVDRIAGVVAALSPGCPWERNLRDAETLISAYVRGTLSPHTIVGVYGHKNKNKALDILDGSSISDTLSGRKVTAFYQSILTPGSMTNPIVIDRHAKCLALGARSKRLGYASDNRVGNVKPSEYEWLARHYERAARDLKISPTVLQAVTWCSWRSQNNLPINESNS